MWWIFVPIGANDLLSAFAAFLPPEIRERQKGAAIHPLMFACAPYPSDKS
jgi:hypothetical protein